MINYHPWTILSFQIVFFLFVITMFSQGQSCLLIKKYKKVVHACITHVGEFVAFGWRVWRFPTVNDKFSQYGQVCLGGISLLQWRVWCFELRFDANGPFFSLSPPRFPHMTLQNFKPILQFVFLLNFDLCSFNYYFF